MYPMQSFKKYLGSFSIILRFVHTVACFRWFPYTHADPYFAKQSWAPCITRLTLELSLVNSSSPYLFYVVNMLGSACVTPLPALQHGNPQVNRLWQSLCSPVFFCHLQSSSSFFFQSRQLRCYTSELHCNSGLKKPVKSELRNIVNTLSQFIIYIFFVESKHTNQETNSLLYYSFFLPQYI